MYSYDRRIYSYDRVAGYDFSVLTEDERTMLRLMAQRKSDSYMCSVLNIPHDEAMRMAVGIRKKLHLSMTTSLRDVGKTLPKVTVHA